MKVGEGGNEGFGSSGRTPVRKTQGNADRWGETDSGFHNGRPQALETGSARRHDPYITDVCSHFLSELAFGVNIFENGCKQERTIIWCCPRPMWRLL